MIGFMEFMLNVAVFYLIICFGGFGMQAFSERYASKQYQQQTEHHPRIHYFLQISRWHDSIHPNREMYHLSFSKKVAVYTSLIFRHWSDTLIEFFRCICCFLSFFCSKDSRINNLSSLDVILYTCNTQLWI